ncbi:MAG: CRISPR-associated helicase Cas3' [Candidatus Methylacidiphilales bacterium]
MQEEAGLAGLLHDLGKYSARFQQRLRDPRIHGINHWAAGAFHAYQLKAQSVAFAIDGHHTGLPACSDLRQTLLRAQNAERLLTMTGCKESVAELYARFLADGLLTGNVGLNVQSEPFFEALRIRFLFSCLVDADFLDTELHFKPTQAGARANETIRATDGERLVMAHLAEKAAHATAGAVNQLRQRLLTDCLAAAKRSDSLLTLTAPTGSGKTLASLAFAYRRILQHNASLAPDDPRRLRRIIVVIPYTSIIEQTARVYREILAELGRDYVLEHHSAVGPGPKSEGEDGSSRTNRDAEEVQKRRALLATENWDAPLIVTTSVQFFESLFAHKPSACRKLHNIARSVILFDEVQTLPRSMVPSLLSAVKALSAEPYGSTIVFMTATQPAFAAARQAIQPSGWDPSEISSDPSAIAKALSRTQIILPKPDETVTWTEIAEKISAQPQALCVVNTTKDGRELFRLVSAACGKGDTNKEAAGSAFHLSSRMCPAHRQAQLRVIRERLALGLPVRLISTQLIEAGVDIDFPIAFRAFGPLDSIVQTAGRCNREGRRSEPCHVIVFNPAEGSLPPGSYSTATNVTRHFLNEYPNASLHDLDLYRRYFISLYDFTGPRNAEDDPVFKASKEWNFPEASEKCRLVDEDTRAVLVGWERGAELIEKLRSRRYLEREECREAQRYSVNFYDREFQKAMSRGEILQPSEKWNLYVWMSKYDDLLGACSPEGDDFCL